MSGERIIKTGSYGYVSLIEGNVDKTKETSLRLQNTGILGAILSIPSFVRAKWRGLDHYSGAISGDQLNMFILVPNILNQQKVGEADVSRMPNTLKTADLLQLAQITACLALAYDQRKETEGEKIPYNRGLIISDLLEVLPTPTAARLLFASSNPDIAETIYEGRVHPVFQNIDPQIVAVEGFVLLPPDARQAIFRELVRLGPGPTGRARLFLSFAIGNYYDKTSKYSGIPLIYANLPAEAAAEKVLEFQSEWGNLAEMVNNT